MDVEDSFLGSDDDETLSCGAFLEDLEQQWMPPAGHEGCPHCGDAISALRTLEVLVRTELEREDTERQEETGRRQAAMLTQKIMRTVRTELRPGPLVPMGEPAEQLWITHAAAARAVRRAVDALPGIQAGRCQIAPAGAVAGPRPGRLPRGPVTVRLEIAIGIEHSVEQAAHLVRETVSGSVSGRLGLVVNDVQIAVIDLLASCGTDGGRTR